MPNAPASASDEPKPMTAVERAGGERPVDEGDVDLADLAAFGMDHLHARQKTETDGLLRHRIGAGDDRLRSDHGRDGREKDERIVRPLRGKRVERAVDDFGRIRLGEQQAALAEIIESKRGQRDAEPGDADRNRPEVAHVGVERLAAGHGQESAADHDEGDRPGMPEIGDSGQWAQRRKHGRFPDDSHNAEDRGDDEPDQHDGSEQAADEGRAVALDEKQDDEDDDRQRNHEAAHLGRVDLQSLDRAQDGNRRRYRAVAVEQGRADEADHDHGRPPFVAPGAPRADQREQRQNAAFAVVVGAHDEDRVFDRDDDDQRPEDQRHACRAPLPAKPVRRDWRTSRRR